MLQLHLQLSAFPQKERMRFLAQELVVIHLEPLRNLGVTENDLWVTNQVIDAANRKARGEPPLGRPTAAIDRPRETVMAAAAEWQSQRELANAAFAPIMDDALHRMELALASPQCRDCEHDPLCSGLVMPGTTPAIVEPLCLRSLYALAKGSAKFTEDLYERHLASLTQPIDIDLYFVCEADSALRVTGVTYYRKPSNRAPLPGKRTPSWVLLGLPLKKLESDNYFPIVYVLAHELAVHAVQELLRSNQRDHPTDRVAFAEGLIDRVIYLELIEAIRAGKTFPSSISLDALLPIDTFHSTRRNVPAAQETFWAQDIGYGRLAYEALRELAEFALRNELLSMAPAEAQGAIQDWAHAAALALNVLSLSEDERHAVVKAMMRMEAEYKKIKDSKAWLDGPEDSTLSHWVGALGEMREDPSPDVVRESLINLAKTILKL
jgi:hypothetical protein